ncbi:SDR family oxidoreductase [Actinomadura rifamycini]|uniref:SDR family oxidoreductase n=1 Tax=Actinomadura rifamycini TaxID=31962 RepID=UPI0009FC8EBB|nr:SDR family oxidoreductase [Actinomadura rifamycini]
MRLLVAGATGQLGAGLLETMGEAGCTMIPLLRVPEPGRRTAGRLRPPDPALVGEPVRGDVRVHRWGLDEAAVRRLADEADAVVNLAGQTNWAGRGSDIYATHVLGAEHGYLLARELTALSGRRIPYLYAGSAYAAGGAVGAVAEQPYPRRADRTVYEQAKLLAERRLTALAGEDSPLLILRLCALVGNSATGRTLRRNSLYMLADRWDDLPGGVLPAMPAARVDALPRDVAARTLLRAVRRLAGLPGTEALICHLGLGETAPSVRGLLDAAFTADPERFRRAPRVVSASARQIVWTSQNAHRFLPLTPTAHNALIGLRYVGLDRVFDRSRLAALLGGGLPEAGLGLLAGLLFGPPRRPDAVAAGGSMARFPG